MLQYIHSNHNNMIKLLSYFFFILVLLPRKSQGLKKCYKDGRTVSCPDRDSWPNIGKAFRGYDMVAGDPTASGPDPGYRGLIFDEIHERSGPVRFENTNARHSEQCSLDKKSVTIKTGEEYQKSIFNTKGSGYGIKIGSEVDVKAQAGGKLCTDLTSGTTAENQTLPISGLVSGLGLLGGALLAPLSGGASLIPAAAGPLLAGLTGGSFDLPIPGIPYPGFLAEGTGGLDVNAKIPPLLQASSSNSESMSRIISSLETNLFSLTKSTIKCYLYTVEIQTIQHPVFKKQFVKSVKHLSSCLERNAGTLRMADCAREFFNNYGTHYISRAKFGSKSTFTKMFDNELSEGVSDKKKEKCSKDNMEASLFGLFGGNKDGNTCKKIDIKDEKLSLYNVASEQLVTVGSRPAATVEAWAAQIKRPEIIEKQIIPLSDLFTDWFMDIDQMKSVNYTFIKPWLEDQILSYCAVFRGEGRCNRVIRRPMCIPDFCKQDKICGYWTGPIDSNFLPDGEGILSPPNTKVTFTAKKYSFSHGCKLQSEGSWADWEPWKACSKRCDGGTKKRSAKCVDGDWCKDSSGTKGKVLTQSKTCNTHPCEGRWGSWGSWGSCSRPQSCNGGIKKRFRYCGGGDWCKFSGEKRTVRVKTKRCNYISFGICLGDFYAGIF